MSPTSDSTAMTQPPMPTSPSMQPLCIPAAQPVPQPGEQDLHPYRLSEFGSPMHLERIFTTYHATGGKVVIDESPMSQISTAEDQQTGHNEGDSQMHQLKTHFPPSALKGHGRSMSTPIYPGSVPCITMKVPCDTVKE